MKKSQSFPIGTVVPMVPPKGGIKAVPTFRFGTPLSPYLWGRGTGTLELAL